MIPPGLPSLPLSLDNEAKDAWAQEAATLGPNEEARKATCIQTADGLYKKMYK